MFIHQRSNFFCRLFFRKNVPVQFAVLISFLNQKPQDVRAKLPWFPIAEIFLFTFFEKRKWQYFLIGNGVKIDPVKKTVPDSNFKGNNESVVQTKS